MTDLELTRRAEQAYLGAILARHDRQGTHAPVVASDFSDPVHQAIFAAVTGQPASTRPGDPAGWAGRLRDLLERIFSRRVRSAAAYMAELPALCPDPANLPAYAAMIAEASQDRADQARTSQAEQTASEDPTLASASAWLDSTGPATRRQAYRSVAPTTGTVPEAQSRDQAATGLAPDTARLARALRTDARKTPLPDLGQEPERSAGHRVPADPLVRAGGRPVAVTPEDLEERVLASLMKHPADGRPVAGWLRAEAFSTAVLRDLYDLIRQRLASGRPVDPLIIAWDASRLPESPLFEEYGGAGFLTQAALRVGALEPAPGTAEILGRALWAERILAGALGEDWPGDPERIRLLGTLAADEPGPRREPPPAAAVQPATAGPDEPARQPQAGPAETVPEPPANGPAVMTAVTSATSQPSAPMPSGPGRPGVPAQVQVQQPAAPAMDSPALRM